MDIAINKNETANTPQPKKSSVKKYLKIAGAAIILIAIIAGGFFAWKKFEQKKAPAKPEITTAIDQYKQDLSGLKKQAEQSGSKEDLQAYGIAQYATGDQNGAIETYTKQIEKEPNSVVAHSGLANALRDQKKFDEAIAEYEKVIKLSPTDISAYVNLASVYQYQFKQIDKAVEIYKQAIEKNPKSADLYVLVSLAYEQVGDKDSAKTNYEKAQEIDEKNVAAKAGLERIALQKGEVIVK